jgi:hypothetical protein
LNEISKEYNTNSSYYNNSIDQDLLIEEGTDGFTKDVLTGSNFLKPLGPEDFQAVKVLRNEDSDLQKNDFGYQFYFSKRQKFNRQQFLSFKTKIESGTVLQLLHPQSKNSNGNYEIFNLEYSEYIKTEFDYIKHWFIKRKNSSL